VPLDEVTLRPVVPRPAKIFCVGLNYLEHVGETGREIPEYPVLFAKFADTLTGPRDAIVLPSESSQVDYEGEMAVVIGRPGRRIAVVAALDHVGGYTVANDVTMRDYQYKTHQWLQGKVWEASTPLGPWLVTPEEAGDVSALDISLTLNGAVMQAASTAQLMFDVPHAGQPDLRAGHPGARRCDPHRNARWRRVPPRSPGLPGPGRPGRS
jgi:acylpyruvate hydrolase